MRATSFLVGLLIAGTAGALAIADPVDGLPNPALTPGATNPAVTQETIDTTICVIGWTKTIRPPVSYTNHLKLQQLADPAYGYPAGADPHSYELDHLISLELGGNPTDPRNLWPEPWDGPHGAHVKDRVENALHREVCTHRMTLDEAQHLISTNWLDGLKYVGKH